MAAIAGLKMHTTSTGKVRSVTIDMKRWGHLLEDVIDGIIIEQRRNEPSTPWEEVKAKLEKKHKMK